VRRFPLSALMFFKNHGDKANDEDMNRHWQGLSMKRIHSK
jgi:hypothetical protein